MTRHLILLLLTTLLLGTFGPLPAAETTAAGTLSPDGRWRAYVSAQDELWLAGEGQAPRRLLAPHPDDDPKRNLTGFNNPAFSTDGRVLYILTEAWVTSNALHRIDLADGTTRFVIDANAFEVLGEGRHGGALVVQRHTYLPEGGSEEIWYLLDPKGDRPLRIGDDADLADRLQQPTQEGDTP